MLTVVTPPTTNDLTTIETATRELRLDDHQDNLLGLAELIQKASAACAGWCMRPEGFGRATVTQTERLTVSRECIILDRDLNPSITTVVEDGDTLAGSDYEVDDGRLYRLDDDERIEWPAVKIVITYEAGYLDGGELDDLPQEIESACLLTLAAMHQARGENPLVRRSDNGLLSTSLAPTNGGIPDQAAQLLAPFRRWRVL